jgi:Zn-dependent peptidase ImmA (M78 family)/transcriptional regulator with XRE-family HTH domain
MISDRIKHARVYAGLSQEQLAEMAGVSQTTISMVERGKAASPETVAAIAATTGFSIDFLTRDAPLPDLPEGSLRYRKRASTTVRDDERFRGHVRQTIEFAGDLRRGLKLPPVRIEPITVEHLAGDDIELIANETRERMDVGPLDPIPNVIRGAERAGILVIGSSEQLDGHDGASYWPDYPTGQPVVCFTRGMVGDRQRFTVAHEIGHLRLHKMRPAIPTKEAEAEAHRFAGALLFPAAAARSELTNPTLQDLVRAKGRWGISIRATVRRCLDLGIINPDRRLSFEKQIAARGWTKVEPVLVNEERPQMLQKMVETKMGKRRLLDIATRAGIPPMALRDMLS